MKSGDVLKITGISRRHLSSLVKQGKLGVTVKPSGQYDYNFDDVYQYIGKVRQNLNKVDKVFSDIASGITLGQFIEKIAL
ncbi:hypothetical protein TI05_18790 [Achromatium sp. WMS3]|nr:hypothetical protein TI05_18790 [Achromatium sp. WMS3]